MGGGGDYSPPPAPEPPDPFETSLAQSAANRDTAITTALLNWVNEDTPTGTLTYDHTGHWVVPSSIGPGGQIVSGGGIPRLVTYADQPDWEFISTPGSGGGGGGSTVPMNDTEKYWADRGFRTVNRSGTILVVDPRTGYASYIPQGLSDQETMQRLSVTPVPENDMVRDYSNPWNHGGDFGRGSGYIPGGGPYQRGQTLLTGGGGGTGPSGYWKDPATGRISHTDPYTIPEGSYAIPQVTRRIQLSPEQQAIYDRSTLLQRKLLDFGNKQADVIDETLSTPLSFDGLPELPTSGDYDYLRDRYEDAILSRAIPDIERRDRTLRADLAAAGHMPGTEAYNTEVDEIHRARNDMLMQAILASGQEASREYGLDLSSRQQGIQEKLALRNQPINEIGALLSMAPVQMPQFAPPPTIPVAGTDLEGNVYRGYQGELDAWRTQVNAGMQSQAQGNALAGSLIGAVGKIGSAFLPMMFSDRRLKTDIVKITDINGLSLYSFRYRGGGPARVGFMADEVKKVFPQAVHNVGGYDVIDMEMMEAFHHGH